MCVCVCVVTWLQLFTKLSLYCGPRNGKVAISFVLVIICHVQVLTTFYFLYCISPMCFLCPSLGLFISLFLLLALSLSPLSISCFTGSLVLYHCLTLPLSPLILTLTLTHQNSRSLQQMTAYLSPTLPQGHPQTGVVSNRTDISQ